MAGVQGDVSGHVPWPPVPFPRSLFVMPVSDRFRSRREGKRGLRTFCGFAGARAGVCAPEGAGPPGLPGQGHESGNLRAEMMALSRSRPRPRLGWSGRTTRMRGVCGPLAGRYRRRLERPQRRQGDHAECDAVLRRPRRAGSHRVIPARSGSRRPAPPDHQGPHDRQTSSRRRLARAGARTAPGRQTGPFGRYGTAGPAGR